MTQTYLRSKRRGLGMNLRRASHLVVAPVVATLILADSVLAQTPVDTATMTLEEVVVSATRRNEAVGDIPMAVSVVSAADLTLGGAKNLGDYLYTVPGVNYAKDGREGRGDITIRGVTTGALATPMVGTYVDDVPIGSSTRFADGISAYDQRLLDLERIELLKGPQGTLYGASAMGGVLRYITHQPELNVTEGSAGVEVSTTRNGGVSYTVNGVLNAPLTDNTAVRVSLFNEDSSGYVDATGPAAGKRLNDARNRGGRIALLFSPSDDFKIKLSAQVQDSTQQGTSFVDYDLNGRPIADELTRVNLRVREPQDQNNQLYNATLEYDFGWAEFTSITGYQRQEFDSKRDFSTVYSIYAPFFGLPDIATAQDNRNADLDKWTQEFRLVSPSGERFDWLAGVFYTKENGYLQQAIVQTYVDGSPANPILFGPGAGFDSKYEEIGVYATVNFHVTDALTLTGGVRVANNEQNVLQINGGLLAPGPNDRRKVDESPTTFLAAAKYDLTSTSNLYARVASGYRAGGPNLGLVDPLTGLPLADSPTYDSDSLISYELGYKASLAGGALTVDAAVYQLDWEDIQQVIFSGGSAAIGNFGQARIRGAELALAVRPVDSVRLGASLAYIDAELRTDSPVGLQALSGARLPNSAKFSANLNARYEFDVTPNVRGHLLLEQLFQGDRNTGFDRSSTAFPTRPNMTLPSFDQTDLTLALDFDRFSVGLFARNLFDKDGLLAADTTQAPVGGTVWATPLRPRTIGVNFSTDF